ncbi:heavy-metal-associated domain-containing protein [Dinoroseobacter sp. PD6]|jgi:copper chaperone|uniref:Copper chaperone n=1 Tax=Pseudooceanicola nitratireducens TaxID=517719 RepID=A0A1I1QNW1_9RHOB|nr:MULTISPECIES: heavy-metal-associated domain-containing protein [Rhodobacterales]MDD9718571.1 heavy-metal-associated domain-containing protein [Dinoroseobacter sp. PD6]SEJ74929.1 copper chaperone [Pseudooceanicola nitratireducens]SFD23707.1 copper chaperone [Pseudooceanicola nitratireducens]
MKFHVPDMSCGHCIAAIEKAVKAADPSATIRPDLAAHTTEIDSTASSSAALLQVLAEAGYPATALEEGPED